MASAPNTLDTARIWQQLDGKYAVYAADGRLIRANIDDLSDARACVLEPIAAVERPTSAYHYRRRSNGSLAIYDDRGPVLGYEDIPCRGEAESHILDLIAADEAKAQRDAFEAACDELEDAIDAILAEQQAHTASLDDHHAQAVAMAYGPAVTEAA